MYQINTKISWSIAMFNANGTANQANQILEAVDIILWYKIYLEHILLVISSLSKQDLILRYLWLKNHNPEVNWEKRKVEIMYCPQRCYNWRLRVKLTKKPCIGLIQENLIEFQVQSVYLIYTRLMVHAILNLAYSKEHVYYILLTYSIILFSETFYILLYVTWSCDCDFVTLWYVTVVTVTYAIMLNPNSKFQNKIKNKREK